MNESAQTLKSTTIEYGMYFGLIVVVYNFIAHIMGISNEFSWTAVGVYYAVFCTSILVIIPLSQFNFRKLRTLIKFFLHSYQGFIHLFEHLIRSNSKLT